MINPDLDGGIGILGGSFDPVHSGHLEIASAVRNALNLSHVVLVPTWRNPFKKGKKPGASADDRLEMARIAANDMPWLHVDPFEIARGSETGSPSYTIDTLKYFKNKFPGQNLVLILGSDNTALHNWFRIADFPGYLGCIAIVSRPAFSTDETVYTTEIAELKNKFPDVFSIVKFMPVADVPVSATEIRSSMADGTIPDGVLHPDVERYIRKNCLYGISEAAI